ncbi:MAG: alkaline phosphatase family protein [Lacibacter sp.]
MRLSLLSALLFTMLHLSGQPAKHSHNDYEQTKPFFAAYQQVFESIEADIFLKDGELFVAHNQEDIKTTRKLINLYLQPLVNAITANKGTVYADPNKKLQLLIDIKTEASATLATLVTVLKKYPAITNNRNITFVISGNRPKEEEYKNYPDYILFDGRPGIQYSETALKKVALISIGFNYFSKWDGNTALTAEERSKLSNVIYEAKKLNKPFRFWGCPDTELAWKEFIQMGVDYINTDRIVALSAFFKAYSLSHTQLHNDSLTLMPYNRIIKSAGTVIRFGDPSLENHALDVINLPGTDLVVVEDRYGISLLNIKTAKPEQRVSYADFPAFKNLVSTYSGIKTFTSNAKTYIVWSAAQRESDKAFLMYAEFNRQVTSFEGIQLLKKSPASNAIPNEIVVSKEKNETYLYLVLNGNNELLKIKWSDKSTVWTVPTSAAPYGITKANNLLYVTNWAGKHVTDSSKQYAGIPWGAVYTDPVTGATASGTVTVFSSNTGKRVKEIETGLHPTAIIASADGQYVYVCNGSSDNISIIDTKTNAVIETVATGMFNKQFKKEGSTPNGLTLSGDSKFLYVSNGMDNAVAVIALKKNKTNRHIGRSQIIGFIPTEAYPAGLVLKNNQLVVANLESTGANVVNEKKQARSIHNQLASVSIITVPANKELKQYMAQVYEQNMMNRMEAVTLPARSNIAAKPVPERIGEPSVFKHVIYIIKENKTYDQVLGDMPAGRGDSSLCVFGKQITPNTHAIALQYGWMDNYYASGKSSAEGHQWTDAGMVSDYVEKNVRAWLRSYPHRQEDALVYNKTGFIWNHAMSFGKTVRVYGEACTTVYDGKLQWIDLYKRYQAGEQPNWYNKTTIEPMRGIISPSFPDCDNMVFSDQQRATEFIKEFEAYEMNNNLPNLMILSLPNDHSAGTSPGWPTPDAMVADNDLALGRILEKITHSRFWDSTVVFITQDDSQSGWDHISAYRTVGFVVSPYSKQSVTTTHYNQTSMLRTIEQILGIPPMHVIDATATPMFDCFDSTGRTAVYSAVPNNVPLDQMNKPLNALKGKERVFAIESMNGLFNEVDGGKDDAMNKIIWFYKHSDKPYPALKK